MAKGWYRLRLTEKLDYTFDWAGDDPCGRGPKLETGETIVTSTIDVPAGLTKLTGSKPGGGTYDEWDDATSATVFVSATQPGVFRVDNHVVTSYGRDYDRSIHIVVKPDPDVPFDPVTPAGAVLGFDDDGWPFIDDGSS